MSDVSRFYVSRVPSQVWIGDGDPGSVGWAVFPFPESTNLEREEREHGGRGMRPLGHRVCLPGVISP